MIERAEGKADAVIEKEIAVFYLENGYCNRPDCREYWTAFYLFSSLQPKIYHCNINWMIQVDFFLRCKYE